MKTCLKCKSEFPLVYKLDGKRHNLSNRKFCLDCSPFKQHNTINLIAERKPKIDEEEIFHKICKECCQEKPIEEFYTSRHRKLYYPNCRSCHNNKAKLRQKNVKKQAVEYKGNKCQICFYDKCINALEFHHKDPKEKEFTIAELKNSSFNKLKNELDKCLLVCSNCHREIHAGITKLPPI